jgi:hypothetical protein
MTLAKIPLVEDFAWSSVQSGQWEARFAIRCTPPLVWGVLRRLAFCLNSCVVERRQRQLFIFKPLGEDTVWHAKRLDAIYWSIEPTAPWLDPSEVAEHLERVLLSRIHVEGDWVKY